MASELFQFIEAVSALNRSSIDKDSRAEALSIFYAYGFNYAVKMLADEGFLAFRTEYCEKLKTTLV